MEMYDQPSLQRIKRLILDMTKERLQLNLSGMKTTTEAATGPFAVTASIAALAGAQVEAIAADSSYGSFTQACNATAQIAEACGVLDRIRIVTREDADFENSQIITNTGFVRPIDRNIVKRFGKDTVVPLMYDAVEIRPDEIDLEACEEYGIQVVGTNEDHHAIDVLSYCGPLAVKLVFEAGFEILRNRIVVVGSDLFIDKIENALTTMGAEVTVVSNWDQLSVLGDRPTDVFICSDYDCKLGPIPDIMLTRWEGTTLIQFTGGLNISPFAAANWRVIPNHNIEPFRMYRTLAHLGVSPVIELHAAGLKTAELTFRKISDNTELDFSGLRQPISMAAAGGKY
jgi:hypothetical protein